MSLQDLFKESHYWDNGSARPYSGILAQLCRRWNEGSLYNSLPVEAHGTGGLSVTSLLQILEQCDLTDFDICFVQIGENDVKTAKDDPLGLNNALIDIVEEFHRQGVRRVVFGSLFPRHHSDYNKRCNRLNKLLRNIHPDKLWGHGPQLMNNDVINTDDHVHLFRHQEPVFVDRIREALHKINQ